MSKILGLIASLFLIGSLQSQSAFGEPLITLEPNNVITLRGEVDSTSVSKVVDQIAASPSKTLFLFIDSPGGSVVDGVILMDAIRSSGKRIRCVVSSAASMAFSITQACHERLVLDNAILMQHVGSYTIRGQSPNNNSLNSFVQRLFDRLSARDAKRIGMTLKDFKAKIRDDWWLFGDEAVAAGVADKVVAVRCSEELTKKRVVERAFVMFGSVEVVYSGCPLASDPLEIKQSNNGRFGSLEYETLFLEYIRKLSPRRYLLDLMTNGR